MSPDRAARWALGWVRLYTTRLPDEVADRRRDELRSDLHDQIVHDRAQGHSDTAISARIGSRSLRGLCADLTWRRRQARHIRPVTTREHLMTTHDLRRSARHVIVATVVVLAIPFLAMAVTDEVTWSLTDFGLLGILLVVIGMSVEAARLRRGSTLVVGVVAGLGVTAIVGGELDDAPGLIVLGALMLLGAGGILIRRRSATA